MASRFCHGFVHKEMLKKIKENMEEEGWILLEVTEGMAGFVK